MHIQRQHLHTVITSLSSACACIRRATSGEREREREREREKEKARKRKREGQRERERDPPSRLSKVTPLHTQRQHLRRAIHYLFYGRRIRSSQYVYLHTALSIHLSIYVPIYLKYHRSLTSLSNDPQRCIFLYSTWRHAHPSLPFLGSHFGPSGDPETNAFFPDLLP